MTDRTLLLVGCGKMGSALLSQWQKTRPAGMKKFWVIELEKQPIAGMKATWIADLKFLPKTVKPDVIVFAVKPQQLSGIMPAYRTRFKDKPLYLSIAAGKTLGFFATHFGSSARVVRAMPNTPSMVGKGMTALCASASCTALPKKIAGALMEAVGNVEWFADEALMDATTALSGSGPAYMFLFLDSLTKAAMAAGLSAEVARKLAIETMAGSCELARQSKESFEALREQVTSPGGTTEAALSVLLEDSRFEKLLGDAVKKAIDRARQLAQ